jgi:uracil-DNA glycosylase
MTDLKRKAKKLKTMGVTVWRLKKNAAISSDADENLTETDGLSNLDWGALEARAKACTLCDLAKTRTNVVFGVGNKKAQVMLVGEAPGANEDLQGEPFVGRAGKLLDEMLKSIGLNRKEVYIANILKCRPPNNRDPLPHEVCQCTPYLQKQIEIIQPKVIIAVGRIAAHFLLNTDLAMAKLRTNRHFYGGSKVPLFVIYHPAYLLRSPREKAKAYQDLLKIKKFLVE